MSDDKSGSPPCGIYLHITDVSEKLAVLKSLREVAMVINRSTAYEKNMHMIMFDYDPLEVIALRELVEAVRMSGMVAISGGGVTGFESTSADGVLVEKPEEIADIRRQIGDKAIIGLDARKLQISIKEIALAAVDFVILPADQAKISSWGMLSETLCVAGGALDNDNCGDYAAAGANFVDVTNYIMKHKKGAMQGAVNVLYALELAVQNKSTAN